MDINMYTREVIYDTLKLKVDSFNNKKGINSILPILLEEQPTTWMLNKERILDLQPNNILDVGCGSGFWSILLKSKLANARVVGLDKNEIAINYSKENAFINSVEIELLHKLYSIDSFKKSSFDLIVLAPPYHIYPPEMEDKIPLFARGGYSGQDEFENQLNIAEYHLNKDGAILFNMMCMGGNEPNYINYISNVFNGNFQIEYYNILPRIETNIFLDSLYEDDFYDFKSEIISKYPYLYYTCGIIRRSSQKSINVIEMPLIIDRTWSDRIELHKQINNF